MLSETEAESNDVVKLTSLLNENGFCVLSHREDVTNYDASCFMPHPHVRLKCSSVAMLNEANRLVGLLNRLGVKVSPVGDDDLPSVVVTYDAGNPGWAVIDVMFVSDSLLNT